MKFGKTLILSSKQEWSKYYLDYKLLKKVIKKFIEHKDVQQEGQDSQKNSLISEFFELLEHELKKVNNFYIERETEAIEKFNQLKEIARKRAEKSSLLKKEKLAETNILLQHTLHQFTEKIAALSDFVKLNIKGFSKIVKKFSKHFNEKEPTKNSTEFLEKVSKSEFCTSKKLQEIESQLFDLTKHKTEEHLTKEGGSLHETVSKSLIPEKPTKVSKLIIKDLEFGKMYHFWFKLVENALGEDICIPVIVARGLNKGPVFGITVAIHGNEINGIVVVQRLMANLDLKSLSGTVVAIPIVNPSGYKKSIRYFDDGIDLNSIFPGKKDGNCSDVFIHRLLNALLCQFEYLIDMHTASHGRINCLYVRSDMNDIITARMALLQNPQIIVHNTSKTTLRGAAMALGIKTVTVEIGNPSVFQEKYITFTLQGVYQVMKFLTMIPITLIKNDGGPQNQTTICSSSFWIYTDVGGILEVFPDVNQWVREGEVIAEVKNIFGKLIKQYKAPKDGIVIGKATNPINQSGDRILHLGVVSTTFINKKFENLRPLKDKEELKSEESIVTASMTDTIQKIEADLLNIKTHSRSPSKENFEELLKNMKENENKK